MKIMKFLNINIVIESFLSPLNIYKFISLFYVCFLYLTLNKIKLEFDKINLKYLLL